MFVSVKADKNLGTIMLNSVTYKMKGLQNHLLDTSNYRRLTDTQASNLIEVIKTKFWQWLKKYRDILSWQEIKFLSTKVKENKDPYSYFYLLVKIDPLELVLRLGSFEIAGFLDIRIHVIVLTNDKGS